ncbi:MAG: homoserine kinase [Sphingomonas fennica]
MAVFTPVSAEQMADFLSGYDVGTLVSAKGIAEGVQNSNFLVETSERRFILTLYEQERVDAADLPFFMALTDHLADRGLPVPRAIRDRAGRQINAVAGRPACLIEFLSGVSLTHPTTPQARIVGEALGRMHGALADFAGTRPNALGLSGWRDLAARCGTRLDADLPNFAARIAVELDWLEAHWPAGLPHAAIHADLFPDNVLMLDERLTGIIDFYFACTDVRAWDVAVTHAAWCFEADGTGFSAERAAALMAGYAATFGLSAAEHAAFPALLRGAALRFTLTRAWDWISTPADALVVRKDPRAFLRRLDFYRGATPAMLGL